MQPTHPGEISKFLSDCACAAVRTQEILDQGPHAGANGPSMQVLSFEIDAELALTVVRERAFEIRVSPLDLGYRITHRDTAAADARITITIARVPDPDVTARFQET